MLSHLNTMTPRQPRDVRPTLAPLIIRRWLAPLLLIWLALDGGAPAHGAAAGIDWTLQTTPGNLAWNTVTYGAGKFVALPYSTLSAVGGVLTSSNGRDWTLGTMPANRLWTGVTYANGKFVTVMSSGNPPFVGGVMTSTDGVTWTERTAPDINWSSVTYGGGQFVAVSQNGNVMTSPDGIDWTLQTKPNSCYWRSVTYGNGTFVAVATQNLSCQGKLVMTSSDGVTWTQRDTPANLEWMSVTYGNGKFVAVAQRGSVTRPGAVMTSDDGLTWTQQTPVPNCNWRSVAYGSGLFVAISSSDGVSPTLECLGKRVLTSPDGIAWTLRNSAANITWTSHTYGNGLFAAVASNGASNQVMTSGNVCGEGLPLITGAGALWSQLALPCVPSATTPSVANVFGNSPTANLETAKYDVAGSGWVMNRREVTTTPSSYVKLATTTDLDVGTGYWIKSLSAPVGGKLTVDGTATPTDVPQVNGCAVAAGCKAITVTTVNGDNRYNLVGNPFPYAIDWSKVRVRVGGSGGTVYSPCQAAGVSTGCTGPAAGVANPAVISNVVNIWNGTDYQSFTDLDGSGNLEYFKSFWVNVLPGAFGLTVELLIPAEASSLTQATPTAIEPLASAKLPWYLAWLDWVAPPAQAAAPGADDWRVQLKLLNHVTQWKSGTVKLGQMNLAQPGYDAHDVPKLAPFAKPYLSLVVPHPDWGVQAGDYATDFRPALTKQPQDWAFEVRADPIGSVVFLSWEGDAKILKRSRLIDVQTGKTIKPADKRWAKKGYPITLNNPVQRYVWRYLGK